MFVLLLLILIIFTLLLYWQFLGYPIFIHFITKNKLNIIKDYSYQPFISVVVPTYNERKVIRDRIQNLLEQNYPGDKFEIIVVDSGSTDGTAEIVRLMADTHTNIRVIQEGKRAGKASAINLGQQAARGNIILVTDANTIFSPDVLMEIGPYFQSDRIGAVGGRFVLSNQDNNLVRASSFYWDIEALMREAEAKIDSACLFHGEINAWRKNLVIPDITSLAEDLDMAVQIRQQKYKIAYEPFAIAYEAGPSNVKEQMIQKKRTSLGTIQCIFKHHKYLGLPQDIYTGLIFPSHKTLQIQSPYLLLGVMVSVLAFLIQGRFLFIGMYIAMTVIIFFLSLFVLKNLLRNLSQPDNKTTKIWVKCKELYNVFTYVLLHEYIILNSWLDYLRGHYSVTWQKVTSNR